MCFAICSSYQLLTRVAQRDEGNRELNPAEILPGILSSCGHVIGDMLSSETGYRCRKPRCPETPR